MPQAYAEIVVLNSSDCKISCLKFMTLKYRVVHLNTFTGFNSLYGETAAIWLHRLKNLGKKEPFKEALERVSTMSFPYSVA